MTIEKDEFGFLIEIDWGEDEVPEDTSFPYDELDVLIDYLCSVVPQEVETKVDHFIGIDMKTKH